VFPGHNPWSYTDPYGLRGWAAECAANLRDWSNTRFPENALGSAGDGIVHFISAPLLLGEGSAELWQGYEAYEGNERKLSPLERALRGLGDIVRFGLRDDQKRQPEGLGSRIPGPLQSPPGLSTAKKIKNNTR